MNRVCKTVIKRETLDKVIDSLELGVPLSKIIRDNKLTNASRPSILRPLEVYIEAVECGDNVDINSLVLKYLPSGIDVEWKKLYRHSDLSNADLIRLVPILGMYNSKQIKHIRMAVEIVGRAETTLDLVSRALFPPCVQYEEDETMCNISDHYFLGCYPIGIWQDKRIRS